MLNRIGAGTRGVADARRPVGMDRDRAIAGVGRIDRGLHLLKRHRLRRLDALKAAARSENLDPVGPRRDARLGLLAEAVGVGRAAASGRKPLAGDEHSRPDHPAHVDEIPHGVVDLVRGAEIAYGCHPRLQRPPRVLARKDGDDTRRPVRLAERPAARCRIPEVRHVSVGVDQAGNQRIAAQVDHVGAGGHRRRAHRDNPIVVDRDDHVRLHPSRRVNQPAGPNRPHRSGSRRRPHAHRTTNDTDREPEANDALHAKPSFEPQRIKEPQRTQSTLRIPVIERDFNPVHGPA